MWKWDCLKFTALTNDELYEFHCATLEVLQNTGIAVNSEEHVKVFKDAGAIVDEKKGLVRIPRYIVEECLRKAPKSFVLGGRSSKFDLHVMRGKMFARPVTGSTHIIDLESGEHRPATLDDCVTAYRLVVMQSCSLGQGGSRLLPP